MKIAFFYDWLNHRWGGAERVLLDVLALYPDAPIFTLFHNPKNSTWLPSGHQVFSSFLNKLPFSDTHPELYSILFPLAVEQFNFSDYDLVVSFTSNIGYGLLTLPHTRFICYFFNQNRYIYTLPSSPIVKPLISLFKKIDHLLIKRPDVYLCDSATVSHRLQQTYNLRAKVIYPGINVKYFHPSPTPSPQDYYLAVSRLVSHKNIDQAIHACHQLKLKLIIVGNGRRLTFYQKMIADLKNPDLQIKSSLSDRQLLWLYQHCQALLCPQEEDFGLTSLEAQACGRPVIAYGRGGHTETVIHGVTGFLYSPQTVSGLKQAVTEFKNYQIDPLNCRNNALKFSNQNFVLNFKKLLKDNQ
ncbi:MAG: glycosyltransferase [Candidatus Shapirobacteria bacterium]|jgi:glycosyltransferase involved in cell wall biosynthesis